MPSSPPHHSSNFTASPKFTMSMIEPLSVQEPLPAYMRCLPGSINIACAKFPSKSADPDSDPVEPTAAFLKSFNQALKSKDFEAIANHFIDDGYWRDHLILSWDFHTAHKASSILEFVTACSRSKDGLRLKSIKVDTRATVKSPSLVPIDAEGQVLGIQSFLELDTVIGKGLGVVRLVHHDGCWKVFTLYTRLDEIHNFGEAINHNRPKGVEHGAKPGRTTWRERRALETEILAQNEPAVLVVGAGQAGLTIAARLKALGVETLVIDQNQRIGDNWRNRYDQLVLHDPVWYDHMPYIKFPETWPIFTPKDKLAEFFESYVKLLELNIWLNTNLSASNWNHEEGVWTVTLDRKKEDGSVESRQFRPRHIVQATGHSGKKRMPVIKGMENFQGDRLCHSSEFPGAKTSTKDHGKKAIVVGCCNSGHDIAQDYLENGYDVTIVQRSSTYVCSSQAITEVILKSLYSEDSPPVDDADMLLSSMPLSVLKSVQMTLTREAAKVDQKLLDGLEQAGFKAGRGPDDSGLFFRYFQTGGGYYFDVGASQLIIDGKIKVKQGQEVKEVLLDSLLFQDDTMLKADEIVFATGYDNMRTHTRTIFGDNVADKVGDVWGINGQGEIRGIWTNSGHPGFWFHGGNLAFCRYYSKLLALQIKAQEEGLYKSGEL